MISEGKLNSSTIHTGIAPPQGLALSNFLSNIMHSIDGFCASISAAHEPAGPPPTTATLNFGLPIAIDDIVSYRSMKIITMSNCRSSCSSVI